MKALSGGLRKCLHSPPWRRARLPVPRYIYRAGVRFGTASDFSMQLPSGWCSLTWIDDVVLVVDFLRLQTNVYDVLVCIHSLYL